MKKIIILILALGTVSFAFSQSAENSLLFANQNYYGTARSSAMGGAFSSLGGDMTVAHTNPAGLAILRHTTFSITPALYSNKFSGDGKSGDKTKFILPSTGIIFYSYSGEEGVKNLNFGLTYTQGTNFNAQENFTDLGSDYSLLNDIVREVNKDENGNFNPIKEEFLKDFLNENIPLADRMAYKTKLIKLGTPIEGEESRYLTPLYDNDLVNRTSNILTKGSSGEFAFSVAGNYEDKLYFGATLGIQSIDFKIIDNYKEVVDREKQSLSLLNNFQDNKYLQTRGTGTNLKLGVIYRPTDLLRLGVAIHTPTFYTLEDEYLDSMESHFLTGQEKDYKVTFPQNGETGIYEYNYQTPWKFTFGGSYIFPKIGLLSVDYELTDYASAKYYSEDNEDFSGVNQQIKDTYKMAGTLKIGAEVRLNKQFSLRGGYNYFGSPFSKKNLLRNNIQQSEVIKEELYKKQTANLFSIGLGYRYKNIFVDFSFQRYNENREEEYIKTDYIEQTEERILTTRNFDANTVKLTLGVKF